MGETIISALITGALALAGTVVSVCATAGKTRRDISVSQAVTEERLRALTEEVRLHNNFARRMPVAEEQIKSILHRLKELEKGAGV